jgi:2-phospho-L-lactate guanylyltransferase
MMPAEGKLPDLRFWAAVAFKGPVGGKRRLAGLLTEDERARLGQAMLEDVLDSLLEVREIEAVLLITPEANLVDQLDRPRVRHVLDDAAGAPGGDIGLNPAFGLAQRLAEQATVDALLLMPADLPLCSAAATKGVLRGARSPGVVLVPDRAAGGTNALLLAPPTALDPSFGEGSFERHRRLAAEAGLEAVVVRRPTLALDIDTPSDVAALLASGVDCRARRLLTELGGPERLDRLMAEEARGQARSATI